MNKFIHEEILNNTVFAAFGRASIYSKKASDSDRYEIRNTLKDALREYTVLYKNKITEDKHIQNIINLSDKITNRHKAFLKGERFRIGTAQKALNLYLKYLWCLNEIPEPPHCPFDAIIIQNLDCSVKNIRWTKFDDIKTYKMLVIAAKDKANTKTLPKWELDLFEQLINRARGRGKLRH